MTIHQLGGLVRSHETTQRAKEFVNLARVIALSRGDHGMATTLAHDHRVLLGPRVKAAIDNPQRVYQFGSRQKAAVAAITTLDGLSDYQVLADAFLASLRSFGAFDTMLAGGLRRVPFRTRVGSASSGASGATISQASAKPISKLSLSSTQIDELKVVCFLVLTEELARFSAGAAGTLFGDELASAVAVQTDAEFAAQLIAGAATFTSSGATAENVRADLRVALSLITTSAQSRLYWLVPPAVAKNLAVMHTTAGDAAFPGMSVTAGGDIGGITVLPSDGIPANTAILVDARQLVAASDTIRLDSSREALVNLDSVPDSPSTGTTNFVSLWQLNMVGVRAERYIGVEKITTTGTAVVTGISYVGDSPGP